MRIGMLYLAGTLKHCKETLILELKWCVGLYFNPPGLGLESELKTKVLLDSENQLQFEQ